MATVGLHITRFELVADGDWYAFAFTTANREQHTATLAAIRTLPIWQRIWMPHERAWWIAADGITLLARNLPALQPLVEETIRLNATNEVILARAMAYAEGRQPPVMVPAAVRAAFTALGLPPNAQSETIRAMFRAKAKTAHPDVGGSDAAMVALHDAYSTALHWANQHNPPQRSTQPPTTGQRAASSGM